MEPTASVFLTDEEFEALFGADIVGAIRMLGKYAGSICRQCSGECCRTIRCEFYSQHFDGCPIHAYRPAKCRLYYCDRILENESLTEAERNQLNRPAVEVSKRLRQNWGLRIFIEPPLTVGNVSWLGQLGLQTEVNIVMQQLSNGRIGAELAATGLRTIVERHREERRKDNTPGALGKRVFGPLATRELSTTDRQ